MGVTNTVDYCLPLTVVRCTGTVTRTTDGAARPVEQTTADATLVTTADHRRPLAVVLESRALVDLAATVRVADDLRLVSVSGESTGQAGAAVRQVLGVVVTAAGLGLGGAAALRAPGRPTDSTDGALDGTDGTDGSAGRPPAPVVPTAQEEYELAHPTESDHRARYRAARVGLLREVLTATERLVAAPPGERPALLASLAVTRGLLAEVERSLVPLDAHHTAWLAARRTVTRSDRSIDIPTDELPPATILGHTTGTTAQADVSGLSPVAREVWETLGLLVTVAANPDAAPAREHPLPGIDRADVVWVRVPRPVTWALWRRDPRDEAEPGAAARVVLVREGTSMVLDDECGHRPVRFRRSLWARRSTAVELSPAGSLSALTTSAGSVAVGLASAAADATDAVGSGLDRALAIGTARADLADAAAARRLADVTRVLDTRTAELAVAGLEATAADHAELARLQQRVALEAAGASLDPATLTAAELTRSTALTDARTDASRAARELAAETELATVRLELERLKAQWALEHPGE